MDLRNTNDIIRDYINAHTVYTCFSCFWVSTMKILIYTLVVVNTVLCEVPPPYPTRGFRPSPPLLSSPVTQPQSTYNEPNPSPINQYLPPPQPVYGVPKISANYPSKITSPSFLVSKPQGLNNYPRNYPLPAKIINGVIRPFDNQPQSQNNFAQAQQVYKVPNNKLTVANSFAVSEEVYGAPANKPAAQYGVPNNNFPITNNFAAPQQIYGAPSNKTSTQYGVPNDKLSVANNFAAPQQNYGAPANKPSTQYGAPNSNFPSTNNFAAPQQIYGAPSNKPSTQFGLPNDKLSVANNFAAPQQNYGAPANKPSTQYGVPNNNFPSTNNFAAPQQIYGAPSNKPSAQFGVPNDKLSVANNFAAPQQNYGAPANKPSTQYGVPNDKLSVANNFVAPQQIYSTTSNKPSAQYGVPNNNSPAANNFAAPQQNYGAPANQPSGQFGVPNNNFPVGSNFAEPQRNYGPPTTSPSIQYGVPNTNSVETLERIRQLHQLLEGRKAAGAVQDVGVPTSQYFPVREPVNFKTAAYVTSNQLLENDSSRLKFLQLEPSRQYLPVRGAPNFRQGFNQNNVVPNQGSGSNNIENFNRQYLPSRESPNFRQGFSLAPNVNPFGSNNDNSQHVPSTQITKPFGPQYNPANNANAPLVPPTISAQSAIDIQKVEVKNLYAPSVDNSGPTEKPKVPVVSDGYLTSTALPVLRKPTRPVITSSTSEAPTLDEEEEASESDDDPARPNVAIATAVAGTPQQPQQFFLVQPDGRFQRVTYERTQSEDDLPNEYTANYYFQNIQPDPGAMYAPLVTVGK